MKKKVLIVDDSDMARLYHSNILHQAGYDVECAINGAEAYEKAITQDFDIFLTDINMPTLDGYSFIRKIRKEAATKNTPVVIISTEADTIDKKIGFEAGANFYITKPVEPSTLIDNIKLFIGV